MIVTVPGVSAAVRIARATAIATAIEITPGAQFAGCENSACLAAGKGSGGTNAAIRNVKAYSHARIWSRRAARLSRSAGSPVVARSAKDVERGFGRIRVRL